MQLACLKKKRKFSCFKKRPCGYFGMLESGIKYMNQETILHISVTYATTSKLNVN